MDKIRITSLFCEDVRIEHDGRCTLVGVFPTIGTIGDESIEFRQMCYIIFCDVPADIAEVDVAHDVVVGGSVEGIDGSFLEGNRAFKRPEDIDGAESWQFVSYVTTGKVKITGPCRIAANLKIDCAETETRLIFYPATAED